MPSKKQILPAKLILLLLTAFYLVTGQAMATDTQIASDTVYIIQVRKSNNVKMIESTRKSLVTKYPDKKILTRQEPPNYTLSIGYFATEAEAQEFKKLLEKDFPGCLIIPVEQKK